MIIQYTFNYNVFVWALSTFCQLNLISFSTDSLIKYFFQAYPTTSLEQNFVFNRLQKQSNLSQSINFTLVYLKLTKTRFKQNSLDSSVGSVTTQAYCILNQVSLNKGLYC